MDKLEIKRLAKKQTKARISTYAIVVGLVLILYTLSIVGVVGWGFMNSLKHSEHFMVDPTALPDFSKYDLLPYKLPIDDEGNFRLVRGVFANYELVMGTMQYTIDSSYFGGLFVTEEIPIYLEVYGFEALLTFLKNSALTMFAGTFLPVYLSCIMGYLTVNYRYKFSEFIYAFVLFTMIIPIIGAGPTMINLQQSIGFYDNMVGFFIWNCQFTGMFYLIMFSFFQSLSSTYFEAAEIDGASQLRLIISIAIPMANVMLWAGIVSNLINTWNDYMTPLTYLPSYPTLAYGIFYNTRTIKEVSSSQPSQIAALFILALPALIFFTALRKKLMGNISIGGIKG